MPSATRVLRPMPPVSMRRHRPPGKRTGAYRQSRVTPGTSSTIALRAPIRRLKSVDLPTLGRPTIATTGSLPGRAGAFAIFADDDIISQTHFGQSLRILRPARIDANEEFKKNSATEQALQLLARLLADLFQHAAVLADQNPLVRIALGMDRRRNHDQIFLFFLGKLVDGHRDTVGNLFAREQKDFLADDLGREKTLRLVGVLAFGEILRPVGKPAFDNIQNDI